MYYKADTN